MPYIPVGNRMPMEIRLREVVDRMNSEGDLNFAITYLCLKYLDGLSQSYANMNAIIGVLECAKQEFYRRVVVPYEETKRKENGDVYEGA